MCAALKKFYDQHQRTPVAGIIPDMTSYPEHYLKLQAVYANKGAADLELMKGFVAEILKERGLEMDLTDELTVFCKNANYLEVTKVNSLKNEIENFQAPEEFQWELHDFPDGSCHMWYLTLRVVEQFRDEHDKYPGMSDIPDPKEFEWLNSRMTELVAKITPD